MKKSLSSLKQFAYSGNAEEIAYGKKLVQEGKVGCIVLAGGDGTRLGHDGPKGTFPISLIKKKTLFQLLSERVDAASSFFGKKLPAAIMTSLYNHEVSKKHAPKFDFFIQNNLPLLDQNFEPLSLTKPSGNGEALQGFYQSGLYKTWKQQGVDWVNVILIDNPLADPFDPNLCGHAATKQADVVLKGIERENNEQRLGSIGEKSGRIAVFEYTEGVFSSFGNTSLFCFSMDFIEKIHSVKFPIHFVKKMYDGKLLIKQERYIFDVLDLTNSSKVLIYPRQETFFPLKEKKDLPKVQAALLARDRKIFEEISGKTLSDLIFELHPLFYYPTNVLKAKWQNRLPKQGEYLCE